MRIVRLSACRRFLALCLWLVSGLTGVVGVGMALTATATLHIPSSKATLPNGLTVVVSEKHKLPLTHVSIRIKAGSAHDPEEKAGLADLTARLLDKGTAQRTATAIAEELDFLGARLGASAGGTGSTLNLSILAKDIEQGLALLSDVLQHPAFDLTELERVRGRMLSEIHQRRVDPRQVVSETFRELLYAGHPLHRPVSGYPETVPRITRDDVQAFHQRFYVPENVILVMVGDFSEGKMRELLERHLGSWQTTAAGGTAREPPPRLAPPAPLQGKKVRVVDMDVNQTYVQFGHLAVRRADPAFASLRAMNYILGGGGLISRLSRSLREEQGLVYSVHSDFIGGSQFPGFFYAALQTKIETTSQALSSLFAGLERMKREPASVDELTDMKLYYEGSLPRRAETYGQVADLLLEREFYELPEGFWVSEINTIQQFTPQDLQRVATRYLDTGNFVLALVSKREKLDLTAAPIPADAITYVPAP